MSCSWAIDYSWSRPAPDWVRRSGFGGVLRYLCDTPGSTGKKMDKDELASILDAGLEIAAIWEETSGALTGGAETGADDGARACAAMKELDAPDGAVVYFCADSSDVTADQAIAYLTAAQAPLAPYRLGLYGGADVIEGVHAKMPDVYLWQTASWSGDRIAKGVRIYQGVHEAKAFGGAVDVNTVFDSDWGQWSKGAQPQGS